MRDQDSPFRPILNTFGEDIAQQMIKEHGLKKYCLSVFNLKGDEVFCLPLDEQPLMVELSLNSDQNYWREVNEKSKQVTLMYVPSDHSDYIHVVILNYNSKKMVDERVVQQYKIRDWTGVLKKQDKASYSCGLTAQNILVILDKDVVHYMSLSEALRESGKIQATINRDGKLKDEFIEVPRAEYMMKSIRLSKGESNCTYNLRGMLYEKSEITGREDQYNIIIHYDVIQDGIREPLGFLFLSAKKQTQSQNDSPILNLQLKSKSKEFSQDFKQKYRSNMGEIVKVETLTQYDQNSESTAHFTIVQFQNNYFDIYHNFSHADFIAPGARQCEADPCKILSHDQDQRYLKYAESFETMKYSKKIDFFDAFFDRKQLIMLGKNSETGSKDFEFTEFVVKSNLSNAKRVGSETFLEPEESRQKCEDLRFDARYEKIVDWFKPYSSFNQSNHDFYLTHHDFVSFKKFGQPSWKHFKRDKDGKMGDKIICSLVNKAQKIYNQDTDQLCIVTQSGCVQKVIKVGANLQFCDSEQNKSQLEGSVKQIILDDAYNMFHLIRCEKKGTNNGKVYLLRNTENLGLEKKRSYLNPNPRKVCEDEKRANIIMDITKTLKSIFGENLLQKAYITSVFSSRKNTPIFAILKRGQNGRDIIVRAFSITQSREAHKPKITELCNLKVNALHSKEKIMRLNYVRNIVLRFCKSREDADIKSLILVDDRHWLHINLERVYKFEQVTDQEQDSCEEAAQQEELDPEVEGGNIYYKAKLETCLHMGLYLRQIYMVGNFAYTIHDDIQLKELRFPVYEQELKFDSQKRPNERRVQHYTTPTSDKTFVTHSGIGLIDLEAYNMDPRCRPQILPVCDIDAGVSSQITFDDAMQSLLFRKDIDEFNYLPLPHNNTLPFAQAKDQNAYLIQKQLDNFFVAVEKTTYINEGGKGTGKQKNYIEVPAKFTVWKMQNGLPVPAWHQNQKNAKLPYFKHEIDRCPRPKDQQAREEAKCAFIGVDHKASKKFLDELKEFEVWNGQCSSKIYKHSQLQKSGDKIPGFYQQNLFQYSLIFKKMDNKVLKIGIKDGMSFKKMISSARSTNVVLDNQETVKNNVHMKVIELKMQKRKIWFEQHGQIVYAIKLIPSIKIHFEFDFRRWISPQEVEIQDIFFSDFIKDRKKAKQNNNKQFPIKMLEIHGENINIYDLKNVNPLEKGPLKLTVEEKQVQRVKKFPFELVENAYNVFNLFSPDFNYYLDWCHMKDSYMVIDCYTNNVMYTFGKNFLKMQQKNIQAVQWQLKFMTWYDEDHILLANSQSDDNFCKVVKVIYEDIKKLTQDGVNNLLCNGADGDQIQYIQEKACFSSPFLQHFRHRQHNYCVFNYFNQQILLNSYDTSSRYMRKHNALKKYLYLTRPQQILQKNVLEDIHRDDEESLFKQDTAESLQKRRDHNQTIREINNILFSVDYTSNRRFQIELPFSCYDWAFFNIIEENYRSATSDKKDSYLENLLTERAHEACLMILPQCKTLLSEGIKNVEFQQGIVSYIEKDNQQQMKYNGLVTEIPFIKNFEGRTPLHSALDPKNFKAEAASYYLNFLSKYQVDQHSFEIKDILPEAIDANLQTMPEYLKSRKRQTKSLEKMKKIDNFQFNATKGKDKLVTDSEIWFNFESITKKASIQSGLAKTNDEIFVKIPKDEKNCLKKFSETIWCNRLQKQKHQTVAYLTMLDIPGLCDLTDDTDSDRLMSALSNVTTDEDWKGIFNLSVVQAIIDYRWQIIRPRAIKFTFIPWILYVGIYTYYCFWSTTQKCCVQTQPELPLDASLPECILGDDITRIEWCDQFESDTKATQLLVSRILLIGIALYMFIIEVKRMMIQGCKEYFNSEKGSFQNYLNIVPNVSIATMAIIRWIRNDVHPSSLIFLLNALSFLLLMSRVIYFFGMFRELSRFNVIINAVISQLMTFFAVFFIIICIFLVPFLMYNQAHDPSQEERPYIFEQSVSRLYMAFPAFNSLYMSSIGEYGFTEAFDADPSFSKWICWILFIISTVVIQLIMLNLIIAIITATYEEVLEELNAAVYLARARLVVDNIHLVDNKTIEQRSMRNWLVTAEPFDYKKSSTQKE